MELLSSFSLPDIKSKSIGNQVSVLATQIYIRDVKTVNLTGCPQFLDKIVGWNHEEWSHLSGRKLSEIKARFTSCLQVAQPLPTTFVAIHNEQPIGVGSFRQHDNLLARPELFPWIDNVDFPRYVGHLRATI